MYRKDVLERILELSIEIIVKGISRSPLQFDHDIIYSAPTARFGTEFVNYLESARGLNF